MPPNILLQPMVEIPKSYMISFMAAVPEPFFKWRFYAMTQAYLNYLLALLLFGTNGIVASFISLSSYEIVFLAHLNWQFTLGHFV